MGRQGRHRRRRDVSSTSESDSSLSSTSSSSSSDAQSADSRDSSSSSSGKKRSRSQKRRIRSKRRKYSTSESDSDRSSPDRRKGKRSSESRPRLKEKKRKRHRKVGDVKHKSHKIQKNETLQYAETAEMFHKSSQPRLQAVMETREQQKAMLLKNAEIAKARLVSGDLHKAKLQQMKMQDMYGAVDWRAKKKLRLEKKRLERTIAAGNKLASLEEREAARMDAFRVALGLPTAEAQRQAEWRLEATRALDELGENSNGSQQHTSKPSKKGIIGPKLPRL